MNIAVIRLRDVFKYLVGTVMIAVMVTVFTRFFASVYSAESKAVSSFVSSSFTGSMDMSLALMSYSNTREDRRFIRLSSTSSIFNLELSMLDGNFMISDDLKINEDELTGEDVETLYNMAAERPSIDEIREVRGALKPDPRSS